MASIIASTRKEYEAKLASKLKTNDTYALRGLMVIYNRQTPDEKYSRQTKYHNDRGFTAPDAKRLTSYGYLVKNGYSLTDAQLNDLRNRMVKYASQLMDYSLEQGNLKKIKGYYVVVNPQ